MEIIKLTLDLDYEFGPVMLFKPLTVTFPNGQTHFKTLQKILQDF